MCTLESGGMYVCGQTGGKTICKSDANNGKKIKYLSYYFWDISGDVGICKNLVFTLFEWKTMFFAFFSKKICFNL